MTLGSAKVRDVEVHCPDNGETGPPVSINDVCNQISTTTRFYTDGSKNLTSRITTPAYSITQISAFANKTALQNTMEILYHPSSKTLEFSLELSMFTDQPWSTKQEAARDSTSTSSSAATPEKSGEDKEMESKEDDIPLQKKGLDTPDSDLRFYLQPIKLVPLGTNRKAAAIALAEGLQEAETRKKSAMKSKGSGDDDDGLPARKKDVHVEFDLKQIATEEEERKKKRKTQHPGSPTPTSHRMPPPRRPVRPRRQQSVMKDD